MEDARKTRRNTRIVLALVLLSGILHSFQAYLPPFFDTLIYTIRYTLHTGILLYWLQSVRHRLVRSTSRTALLMAGCLLIAMEVISCCKYRFMDYDREVEILLWYLYYVPMLMVTTLFFLAGLSFLGFGAQPPAPEWGLMLNEGRAYMQYAPWMMVFPGLAILITVVIFNLLGDSLRDVLDVRDE